MTDYEKFKALYGSVGVPFDKKDLTSMMGGAFGEEMMDGAFGVTLRPGENERICGDDWCYAQYIFNKEGRFLCQWIWEG